MRILNAEQFENMTEEEFYLRSKAIGYEDMYFKDLTLRKFQKYISTVFIEKDGKWIKVTSSALDELYWKLDISEWCFKIVPDKDMEDNVLGKCEISEKTIKIAESQKNKKSVLLHEMIHAYEYTFDGDPVLDFYKQIIVLDLYDRLSKKISNIKKHLIYNVHGDDIIHSPLFMIKSLELDLRLNYPLGKVYGYGKEEIFTSLKCIKN